MSFTAQLAIAFVAISQFAFLMMEMMFWDDPLGYRVFGTRHENAFPSKQLAATLGLFGSLLAVGLVWTLVPIGLRGYCQLVATFFLICIALIGIVGGKKISKRLYWLHVTPATLALFIIWTISN